MLKKFIEEPCCRLQAILPRKDSYMLVFIRALNPWRAAGKTHLIAFQLIGIVLFMTAVAGCLFDKEVQLSGRTMGTSYNIKIVTGCFESISGLQKKIDIRLSMNLLNKCGEFSSLKAPG